MHTILLPLILATALPMAAAAQPGPARLAPDSQQAMPGAVLTLPAALDLVFQSNPELAAKQHEVRANDGALRQAGVIRNPEIVASVEDRQRPTRTSTVQLNQPLELGGKRAARIAVAARGRDAALADLAAARADAHADTVIAFYDVLAAQQRQGLAESSGELARSAVQAAARRVAAGKISPVDETRARLAESAVRIELSQASAELSASRSRLAALWGAAMPRSVTVEGKIDVLPPLPALADLLQGLPQAPAMWRAKAELERRKAMTQLEQARRIPDLTLSVGSKRDEQLGRSQAIVGLSLPLPLFDRNQGNLDEALARRDQARDGVAATETRLAGELAMAHERLAAALAEAQLVGRDILPGARGAYDAAATGFEYGKFGFLDVLDAQRTLLQAQSQHLRVLVDAHRAAAEIERILGRDWTHIRPAPSAAQQ